MTRMTLPPELDLLIPADAIAFRLRALAAEIARTIAPAERPIAVVVLQGAFVFAADLLRQFPPEFAIDVAFLRCQSYGNRTTSSGRVMLLHDLDADIDLHGRTVLLIDDILDTGNTIRFLEEHLRRRGAARVRLCVLLTRQTPREPRVLDAEFCGFEIGNEFVVGYGLDFAGRYRQLAALGALRPGTETQ
jgi:hypoxanthine phosphoribosyltransferase